MPTTDTSPAVSPPRRRRWRSALAWLTLLLAVPVGGYYYHRYFARRDVERVIAEIEATDPRWRLEHIWADRKPVPDERNSALVVLKAHELLGAGDVRLGEKAQDLVEGYPAQAELNAEQVAALRQALARVERALLAARPLCDMPEGRYPIRHGSNPWDWDLDHPEQKGCDMAVLILCDALLLAQDGDAAGAADACRAILNVGRPIGDEPWLITLLVRCSAELMAVHATERLLAQTEPAEEKLRALQETFAARVDDPILLQALRGERAWVSDLMQQMKTGETSLSAVLTRMGDPSGPGMGWLMDTFGEHFVLRGQAEVLRRYQQLLRIAELPSEQHQEGFNQFEQEMRQSGQQQAMALRLFLPGTHKAPQEHRRSVARQRAAIAALAAERYRVKHDRWPESLETLVEERLLDRVPVDPFDGQPLRWRRLDDGIVIFSVGRDRADNGGTFNASQPLANGADVGFRLWDVPARRQPAIPWPPADAKGN